MKKRTILSVIMISVILSAATSFIILKKFQKESSTITIREVQPVRFANYTGTIPRDMAKPFDFTYAAKVTTPGVVHVTSKALPKQTQRTQPYNPFKDFFGEDFWFGIPPGNNHSQPQLASGSGVIVSPEGYIVTNNHVIRGADEIEITMNDSRKYTATLIGTDPSTDLALLKIDMNDLPFIDFGNSDSLEVGAWVVAVGNPFNLASTVTAGIVSAKGRNINILESQTAIESFIQTDAAVNPGNSGGALVDIYGRLVGINTAIASPTGTYAGYSFAVPSNLVRKVVEDLKEFGIVQRGFLGVTIRNIDTEIAKELTLSDFNGVLIEEIQEGSAANDAGLKKKDVIRSINGIPVNSAPFLQEVVAQYRPGDAINVIYIREGKIKEAVITLKNKDRGTEFLTKAKVNIMDALGVELVELTKNEMKDLGLTNGVKVNVIRDGKVKKFTDMRQGFIITKIDKQTVNKVDDIVKILQDKKGGVMVEGVYPEYSGTYYYAFGL